MSDLTQFDFWNELSPEMKQSCVKHMNFMERLRLRTTSKSDRAIVDSARFHVDKVALGSYNYELFLEIFVNDEEKYKMIAENERILNDQAIPLLSFVLKCGNIDELKSREYKDFTETALEKVKASAPFRIKKIKGEITEQLLLFLQKCSPDVIKAVHIQPGKNKNHGFSQIMAMKSLYLVPYWNVRGVMRFPTELARKWIKRDMPLGTKLELFTNSSQTLTLFISTFEKPENMRIIEKQMELVRIRTNDETKHILLFTNPRFYEEKRKHVMLVVRADLRTDSLECRTLIAEHFPERRRRRRDRRHHINDDF